MPPVGIATSRSTHPSETGPAKLWLLLVGVNRYQDECLPSLRYSSVDCQGLADALVEATQEFAQKQVKIHHDFASQPPNLATVRASLKQISTAARPQDTVLIYFSGHGMLEPNTEQAVLCLADTQKDNLLETGLRVQELLQLLGNCAAHQQLVWLDACHSGGMTLRGATQEPKVEPLLNPTPQLVEVLQQRAAKSKGFYALLSCDRGQQSWEFPELGHGVFTYYLMRGLRGEAADSQGAIDADGLYRYVYHQTLQYIDKTNQQLRLINQQKRHRGELGLYSEYPLQTPKRIVEGVGELILGARVAGTRSRNSRTALVVEGLTSSQVTLSLSKVLGSAGKFELEYWPRSEKTTVRDVRQAIQKCLRLERVSQGESLRVEQRHESEEPATALLYLRGQLEETEAADAVLLLGEDIALSRSWLRQQLRHSPVAQQIVILDCPVTREQDASLQDWLEDLQLDPDRGQCIIAAASPNNNSEQFAHAILDTLISAPQPAGLSVAGWITQLQVSLAGAVPLHIWLSGARGVMEVLPGTTGSQSVEKAENFDLGLCPYRGLRSFGEDDSQYFYGRETLTQQLISQVAHQSFLAVVGASGSGKSSVVQAGLMAQLRRGKQLPGSEKWWIRKLTPGARPLEALSRRLGEDSRGRKVTQDDGEEVLTGISPEKSSPTPPASPALPTPLVLEGMLYQGVEGFVYWIRSRPEPMVVLVVDQFEELFTLAPSEDRQRFLELLLGAVEYAPDKFKLIVTLRADFIASCLEISALATLLQQSNVLVPPRLTSDDYRRTIVNPAEQVGLKVAPDLVEVLLKELDSSPGDLPLLEFVLEQLWDYRSSGELTLQAYQQQVGGIQGALERKAQAAYDGLDPQAKACARWIFLSLTQLGEGTEDTRRRVFKSDLVVKKYPAELVDRTLSTLTAAKLVVMNLEEDEEVAGSSRGTAAASPEPEELSLELMKQHVTVEVAH
ncbi:MAG TPA: caspase family protein, partial [Allocoleopsis sp.]